MALLLLRSHLDSGRKHSRMDPRSVHGWNPPPAVFSAETGPHTVFQVLLCECPRVYHNMHELTSHTSCLRVEFLSLWFALLCPIIDSWDSEPSSSAVAQSPVLI